MRSHDTSDHVVGTDGPRQILAAVVKDNPDLWWLGWWGSYDERTQPPGALAKARQETLASDGRNGLAQFSRAMAFLAVAPRTRSLNRKHSTYGWKHAAERWHRVTRDRRYEDYYIGEGAFIAACIASGLRIHRSDYRTCTKLSERAWSATA